MSYLVCFFLQVPGGPIEECQVLSGIMVNKDVTHPKMKRRIESPRIVLLDCPLEYKKGESQTSVEMTAETDFTKVRIRLCLQILETDVLSRVIPFRVTWISEQYFVAYKLHRHSECIVNLA